MKIPKSLEAMQKLLAKRQLQLAESKGPIKELKIRRHIKELKESICFYTQPHVRDQIRYLMQKALARKKLKLAELMAQIQKLEDLIRFYSQPKEQADIRYFNYPNLKNRVKFVKFGAPFIK